MKLNASVARSQTQLQKPEKNETIKEEPDNLGEKVTLGIQHRGNISTKDATKMLRSFWEKSIVKNIEVKRRKEFHLAPGYTV